MPPDFVGRQVGALRNTAGNGITVRMMDYRHLHDLRFDELATAKGVAWNTAMPYLVIRYVAASHSARPDRTGWRHSPTSAPHRAITSLSVWGRQARHGGGGGLAKYGKLKMNNNNDTGFGERR